MEYYPDAFNLGIRDVIGAWLVCLVVVAVFFGYPLATAAPDAAVALRHTAADRSSITVSAETCAAQSPPIEFPHG